MKYTVKVIVSSAYLLMFLLAGQVIVAQDRTVNDGIFTEAQVNAGEVVYDASCKTCHNMRFYRDTLKSWNNQPLIYLWETIMGTMPADNPGSLLLEEYTDVIAYILSENGFPAGDMKLDPDNGMDVIHILSP
ncbi:MAG: cytochrome c [Pseudomonadales bacterium]|nr:cytochrome c [Pseudomonadales bacterium]